MVVRWLRALGPLVFASSWLIAPHARAKPSEEPTFVDPRRRQLPPTHRFRLGLQLSYMRLTAAVQGDTKQRFHFVPLLVDLAYQAQVFKYAMIRPSLAIGSNVSNTLEAMPLLIHPQLHIGYQGAILGVAVGYGYFHPLIARKDVISEARNGLGQPVVLHNHHVGGELSFSTRVDRGALSIILRGMGVSSRLLHYDLNDRSWRFMFTFNLGWYFGDGSHQAARRAARQRAQPSQFGE